MTRRYATPSAWVGAVDVPVPSDRRVPAAVFAREHAEAADHALAAFEVAVEDVDTERLARIDGGSCGRVYVGRRIAKRALPEPDVAGGHVQVTCQTCELIERRMLPRPPRPRPLQTPAPQDPDPP